MIHLSASFADVRRLSQANEVTFSNTLITAMKECGIPVAGSLSIRNVQRGRLSMWLDHANKRACWQWMTDEEFAAEQQPDDGHTKVLPKIHKSKRYIFDVITVGDVPTDDDEV